MSGVCGCRTTTKVYLYQRSIGGLKYLVHSEGGGGGGGVCERERELHLYAPLSQLFP